MAKENGRRRLWEFQPFTICRILGLSFDEKDLRKIFKDLKLSHGNPGSSEFDMHQYLAELCRTQNQHAKRVEKLLEKEFAPYKKEAGISDTQRICEFIAGNDGAENALNEVPIAALIWFAARNCGQDKEIETKVFTAVHMKEHHALRSYDELSRKLSGGKVEDIAKQLEIALESSEKLQRRCARLEQKKEELISERDALSEDKSRFVHELEEQRRLNDRLNRMIGETGGEASYEQIEGMKQELAFLREELKRRNKENADLVKLSTSQFESSVSQKTEIEDGFVASMCTCNRNSFDTGNQDRESQLNLNGMKVAYVGGVESLESAYKEMAESFGCLFCYHGGHCEQGRREIASLVEKNDVIFCPVDINSHNACRLVKKVCKLRDKPCCFLRSSGLSALKKELASFATGGSGQRG